MEKVLVSIKPPLLNALDVGGSQVKKKIVLVRDV